VDFKKSNEAEINTQDCLCGVQQHDKKSALQSKNSQKIQHLKKKTGVRKIMARTVLCYEKRTKISILPVTPL
jgi:hypothetical protein